VRNHGWASHGWSVSLGISAFEPEERSMTDTRVLITGATGTVGSAVVDSLSERDGVGIRVGVRDVAAARERFEGDEGGREGERNEAGEESGGGPGADGADEQGSESSGSSSDSGIEYARFDFERPETWGTAFEEVDRLFMMLPPGVSPDRVLDAAAAAIRVGAEHVVYLSALGVERNPLIPHWRVERGLRSLEATYTFLRASFFMQNLAEVHRRDIVERDEVFVPAGRGETSFVDAHDIGAVGATALVEPGHANRAYDVTGPAALDYEDVAGVFADVLDRPITYPNPSYLRFARRMRARGHPLPFVILMLGIYTIARAGLAGRVSDDVARVLDRPPRSLREFVEDYREFFEPNSAVPDGA
jgi:uncharacterized protein YbjT (DUF2867 family)